MWLCFQSPDERVEVRGHHGESVLTIVGVGLSDWGRFDCEALSRIGGHQKSMFLDIECECTLFTETPHKHTLLQMCMLDTCTHMTTLNHTSRRSESGKYSRPSSSPCCCKNDHVLPFSDWSVFTESIMHLKD